MKTLKFPDGSEISYELTRKPVKNVNLRVLKEAALRISANSRVSVRHIEIHHIPAGVHNPGGGTRINARSAENDIGDRVRWLGREYPVRVITNSRECAVLEQEEFRVFTRIPEPEHVRLLLGTGWLKFHPAVPGLDDEVRTTLFQRVSSLLRLVLQSKRT